ncbi:hypothetical protein [Oenococcus sicerae]|nr:hypothetical protein [Oenococcus sicerae]
MVVELTTIIVSTIYISIFSKNESRIFSKQSSLLGFLRYLTKPIA